MKSTDFLPIPIRRRPTIHRRQQGTATSNRLPRQRRKFWVTEVFDWALAVGGFWLIHKNFYSPERTVSSGALPATE